jgi:hypothetical protein
MCAPDTVTFIVPPSGVKTYEFQLVPPAPGKRPGRVMVGANGAAWTATPDG